MARYVNPVTIGSAAIGTHDGAGNGERFARKRILHTGRLFRSKGAFTPEIAIQLHGCDFFPYRTEAPFSLRCNEPVGGGYIRNEPMGDETFSIFRFFSLSLPVNKNRPAIMEKPFVITRLEERFGIVLEATTPQNIRFQAERAYHANARNEVTHLVIHSAFIEHLDYISELTRLEYLDLSGNKISLLGGLANLTQLKYLDLSDNKITRIERLDKLTQLVYLDLSYNHIATIKGLDKLARLTTLNLSYNIVSQIQGLDKLTELTTLNLAYNEIGRIQGLSRLKKLKTLDLSYNAISLLEGLDELSELETLCLADNKLTTIQHLGKLSRLTRLELSGNKIALLRGIGMLTWLEDLDVSCNKIRRIQKLDSLTHLEVLDLSGNEITSREEIESVVELPALEKLNVYGNPFLKEMPSVLLEEYANHLPDLKNYFSAQKSTLVKVVLPVKVMLLGNHSSGKTSFLHYLHTQTLPPETTASTHILDIRPYPLSFSNLPEAIIYDFGGQDYYHGLYQAFFSLDAVNVLMWCNEYDRNQIRQESPIYTRDYTKEYWLYQLDYAFKRKKQDGVQSSEPLLLVQTHADQPDEKRKYVKDDTHTFGIVNEFYISLEKKSLDKKLFRISLEYLRETLLQEIENKKVEEERPVYYQDFLKYILSFSSPDALPVKELKKQYKREKLPHETDADLDSYLKSDLRQLALRGMVLYYPESRGLSEVVWLNPSETIRYIHSEILSPSFLDKKKGIVGEAEFDALCLTHPYIKELLIAEKVIFYDPAQKNYIIPSYLPLSTEKEDEFDMLVFGFSRPDFILKFNCFIPFGLINQLICLYGNNPDKKRFWRDQLIFTYRGAYKIWIKLDFTYLEIAVYIAPKNSEATSPGKIQEVTRSIFRDILELYWGNAVTWDDKDVPQQEETKKVNSIFEYHRKKPVKGWTIRAGANIPPTMKDTYTWTYNYEPSKNIVPSKEFISRNTKKLFTAFINIVSKKFAPIKAPDDMYISLGGTYFSRYKDIQEAGKDTTTIIARALLPETRKIDEHTHKVYPISIYKNFTDNQHITNMKKIFISYSRKDVEYKDELKKHLDLLRTFEIADAWSCEEITIGKWDEQIQKELEESDLIIYMLSAGFFSSKYILEKEVQKGIDSLLGKPGKKALCVVVSAFAGLDKLKAAVNERESSPLQDAVFQLAEMQYLPYCKVKNEVSGNMEEKIVPLKKYPDIDDALAQICEKVLEVLK